MQWRSILLRSQPRAVVMRLRAKPPGPIRNSGLTDGTARYAPRRRVSFGGRCGERAAATGRHQEACERSLGVHVTEASRPQASATQRRKRNTGLDAQAATDSRPPALDLWRGWEIARAGLGVGEREPRPRLANPGSSRVSQRSCGRACARAHEPIRPSAVAATRSSSAATYSRQLHTRRPTAKAG